MMGGLIRSHIFAARMRCCYQLVPLVLVPVLVLLSSSVMGFTSILPPPTRHNLPRWYYGDKPSSATTTSVSGLSLLSVSSSPGRQQQRRRQQRRRQQHYFSMPSSTATAASTSRRRLGRACSRSTSTQLEMSGRGVAPTKNYRWYEEAFELEVTVKVPKETRAKDIQFKATSTSIDLRLVSNNSEGQDFVTLLDPGRPLRGKVNVEGTFWSISDPDEKQRLDDDDDDAAGGDDDNNTMDEYREVTVTIEKQIRTPKDDFDIIEYDWKGLYNDDAEEVSYRHYDEPEELDVREYAASLGVDIDNIDMNLVDKSMFSSGLSNKNKATAKNKNGDGDEDSDNNESSSQATPLTPFEALKDSGLMKEVTQQADGTEWTTDEDGDRVPFSSMGRQNDLLSKMDTSDSINVGDQIDEMISSEDDSNVGEDMPHNPFASSNSPWSKTVPVDDLGTFDEENSDQVQSSSESESVSKQSPSSKTIGQPRNDGINIDPIAELTVAKLKDILRSRGLKVSGNKKELQDRLRNEVQAMMVADNSLDVPTNENERDVREEQTKGKNHRSSAGK